ncbi:hypothetical protein DL769_005906 [Monosporascus sp. CRB-8-3]|nr:hypothetical protein DL769_005906 [Monosporascus sp. CRB-8-3]
MSYNDHTSVEPYTLYLALFTRDYRAPPDDPSKPNQLYQALCLGDSEWHWSIIVTDDDPKSRRSRIIHANNDNTNEDWEFLVEPRQLGDFRRLVLLYKIPFVESGQKFEDRFQHVKSAVNRELNPEDFGYEPIDCRLWLLNLLVILERENIIKLPLLLPELEKDAAEKALKHQCEHGWGQNQYLVFRT